MTACAVFLAVIGYGSLLDSRFDWSFFHEILPATIEHDDAREGEVVKSRPGPWWRSRSIGRQPVRRKQQAAQGRASSHAVAAKAWNWTDLTWVLNQVARWGTDIVPRHVLKPSCRSGETFDKVRSN